MGHDNGSLWPVTFHEGGSVQGGRVQTGGRGRGPVIAGGGIGVVVVTLLISLLSGNGLNVGQLFDSLGGGAGAGAEESDSYLGSCTAEEANSDPSCRLAMTAHSLDVFWEKALPKQTPKDYTLPRVHKFTGSVQTACGPATKDTGPFYCPPDQTVYIDISFFDELQSRFGGSNGALAQEYIVAHEFGHHIENLIELLEKADRSGTGANSGSVKIELMADCLAGMWAGNAATTVDPKTGVPFLDPITDAQLQDALSAAAAVGDDHIQKQVTGQVNPEGFTHGSSEQRMRWFKRGYDGGTLAKCNTFNAPSL